MSLKDQDLTLQQRTDRLLAQEAAARSTPTAPKANTNEEVIMAEEKEKPLPKVELDAEKVNELLDVIEKTRDSPGYLDFNRAAQCELDDMKPDIEEQLEARNEEVKKREAEKEQEKLKLIAEAQEAEQKGKAA